MIPKQFIRVWADGCGKSEIPQLFEEWWQMFKDMHPDYKFVTITSYDQLEISEEMMFLIERTKTCAGISDILRLIAVYQLGGIFVDTDVMPLKSFDPLTIYDDPFLAKRSSKSFESAIIGSPKGHEAINDVLHALPNYWKRHHDRYASVQTGPAFVSSILFGRSDVVHLPTTTFYPYNGWGPPTREEKHELFKNVENFPPEMIAAHFSNNSWGNNTNRKKYIHDTTVPWWD
jgi:mannosyltransferase OCH1-like enzyme